MCFSLRLSSAEVASSKINIGAFFRIARAIAIRWRSPPESTTPRSPTFGLVSVRKSTDKLVCGSLFGSSNDFCLRGAGFAVADVVKQSAIKKADILRNGRNVLMQGIRVKLRMSTPLILILPSLTS